MSTGRNSPRVSLAHRHCCTLLALILSLFAGTALSRADVAARLRAIDRLPPDAACDELDKLALDVTAEADRQACYRRLHDLLPRATPPELSETERKMIAAAREEGRPVAATLVGRYTIALASERFAAEARANGLITNLDLVYLVLRDLFGNDPVSRVGHRYLIYSPRTKPRGYTINQGTLRIWVGGADADNADAILAYAHEMAHAFTYDHPAGVMFSGGFGEGWTDFCKLVVAERLAFLGPPFADRAESLVAGFRDVGKNEYLDTRLPIEDIVSYGPATSLMVELLLATRGRGGALDWTPFERLFNDALDTPPPKVPHAFWPVWMAEQYERYFDAYDVASILRRYRFPVLPADRAELTRWIERDDGAADGTRVVRKWRVLGPIPDAEKRGIFCDPLDASNFVVRDAYSIDGETYRWLDDVPVNGAGVLRLGTLPGARQRCVFYVLGEWPRDVAPPTTLYITSDDEVAVWLDGERIHTFRGNRGTNPRDPDRVFAAPRRGGGQILALVANHGGATGFQLRGSPDDPFQQRYRPALQAGTADERRALVSFVGSRPVPDALVVPLLVEALDDGASDVRVAAADALGGRRNNVDVVTALIARWQRERDDEVRRAVRRALTEITFEEFRNPELAQQWWLEHRREFADSWFVECEQVYRIGRVVGGYYGNNDGCYGGQCVGRDWGSAPEHVCDFMLRAPARGPRTLRLRYASAERDAHVRVRVARGPTVVHETARWTLKKTGGWSDWSWAELPIPNLEPGWYHVILDQPNGSPDLDVIGWQPAERGPRR